MGLTFNLGRLAADRCITKCIMVMVLWSTTRWRQAWGIQEMGREVALCYRKSKRKGLEAREVWAWPQDPQEAVGLERSDREGTPKNLGSQRLGVRAGLP